VLASRSSDSADSSPRKPASVNFDHLTRVAPVAPAMVSASSIRRKFSVLR
jgi:hypothetical protein